MNANLYIVPLLVVGGGGGVHTVMQTHPHTHSNTDHRYDTTKSPKGTPPPPPLIKGLYIIFHSFICFRRVGRVDGMNERRKDEKFVYST